MAILARALSLSLLLTLGAALAHPAHAEDEDVETDGIALTTKQVNHQNSPDKAIARKIERILSITGWFQGLKVTCIEGVVRLQGTAEKDSQKKWADALAGDTDGVVAVINDISVRQPSLFDLNPAKQQAASLGRQIVVFLPYLFSSLVILLVVYFLARLSARIGRTAAERRVRSRILVEIAAKLSAVPVLVLGIYLVLQVAGLTGVAFTLLGGTGALGIVAGFALKNILENYFSSVMISLGRPFDLGDLVEVTGQKGIVERVTTRGTVLLDFDGNHILIPNSTVYGNVIKNFTASPSSRVHFTLSLDAARAVAEQRALVLAAVRSVEGVLTDPAPQVLVAEIAEERPKVDVYFWVNAKQTSLDRARSAAMEKVRVALGEKNDPAAVPSDTRSPAPELLAEAQKADRRAGAGRDVLHAS